ncbi:hypothetical protein BG004_002409 [Podila humilis]|nr:hypothetical protein BG004_002409 [Podila humilis]
MYKSLALLTLLASSAFGQVIYHMEVYNNAGRMQSFVEYKDQRACFCLKNTQSNKIRNLDVPDAKLFWSNDCTGAYDTIARGTTRTSAHWVNSFSLGASGIPSRLMDASCPNYIR